MAAASRHRRQPGSVSGIADDAAEFSLVAAFAVTNQ
jgi:hypothetical protein